MWGKPLDLKILKFQFMHSNFIQCAAKILTHRSPLAVPLLIVRLTTILLGKILIVLLASTKHRKGITFYLTSYIFIPHADLDYD